MHPSLRFAAHCLGCHTISRSCRRARRPDGRSSERIVCCDKIECQRSLVMSSLPASVPIVGDVQYRRCVPGVRAMPPTVLSCGYYRAGWAIAFGTCGAAYPLVSSSRVVHSSVPCVMPQLLCVPWILLISGYASRGDRKQRLQPVNNRCKSRKTVTFGYM